MTIDCTFISDLHGYLPELEGGDLLILAGDYTAKHTISEFELFIKWLNNLDYKKIIVIAGNHDEVLEKEGDQFFKWANCEYLCDSGTEYKGLKIYGTPWSPYFHSVHPKCKAFMKNDDDLEEIFNKIPKDLDILITHTPMKYILDTSYDGYAWGSNYLRIAIDEVKPRFHIFGHVHEQGSKQLMYKHTGKDTLCINCSYVNEKYQPVNKPIRIVI